MPEQDVISQAIDALSVGKAVIVPTDTVYGLGVSVQHAQGPQELYRLKGRASDKPVAWLVGSLEDLTRYGKDVPAWAQELAQKCWPGALTLVVKASGKVSPEFQSEQGTIGLRMPDNQTALDVIRQMGCPLATTSANPSGKPAARTFTQLDPSLVAHVGFTLVDDASKSGVSSTVVDCTHDAPVVLRQGGIEVPPLDSLA